MSLVFYKKTLLPSENLRVIGIINKKDYDQYINRLSTVTGESNYPTYSVYVNYLQSLDSTCGTLTIVCAKDAKGIAGIFCLSLNVVSGLYLVEGGHYFKVPLPPVLPEYLDDFCHNYPCTQFITYCDEYEKQGEEQIGYKVHDHFVFNLPATMEDYISSLGKKHRQEYNKLKRESPNLTLRPVYYDLLSDHNFLYWYEKNLIRWGEDDSTSHITTMMRMDNILYNKRVVYELYDGDNCVGINIGYLDGDDSYIDSIFIPYTDDKTYKANKYGISVIYLLIEHLINSKLAQRYSLGAGGSYKAKYLPNGVDPLYRCLEYTSFSLEYIKNNPYFSTFGYRPTFYVPYYGWVRSELLALSIRGKIEYDVTEVGVCEALESYNPKNLEELQTLISAKKIELVSRFNTAYAIIIDGEVTKIIDNYTVVEDDFKS